jgi:hypothetical protein
MDWDEVLRGTAVALWLLVAAAGLLLIGQHFDLVARHADLSGALLGAAGTIFAGWLAFRTVRGASDRNERARREEQTHRRVAIAEAIGSEFRMISDELASYLDIAPLSDFHGSLTRQLFAEAAVFDGRFGAVLAAAIVELDRFRKNEERATKLNIGYDFDNLPHKARSFAFRARLVAIAAETVGETVRRGKTPAPPFLTAADIDGVRAEIKPNDGGALGYVAIIAAPH